MVAVWGISSNYIKGPQHDSGLFLLWMLNKIQEELNVFQTFEGVSVDIINKFKGQINRKGCETVGVVFSIMETIQEHHRSFKDVINYFLESYTMVQSPQILIIHLKRSQ